MGFPYLGENSNASEHKSVVGFFLDFLKCVDG